MGQAKMFSLTRPFLCFALNFKHKDFFWHSMSMLVNTIGEPSLNACFSEFVRTSFDKKGGSVEEFG